MKWTRQSVEDYARDHGYEPIQIDGIPEGFTFKEADITIGDTTTRGKYILFGPLGSDITKTERTDELLGVYNSFRKDA